MCVFVCVCLCMGLCACMLEPVCASVCVGELAIASHQGMKLTLYPCILLFLGHRLHAMLRYNTTTTNPTSLSSHPTMHMLCLLQPIWFRLLGHRKPALSMTCHLSRPCVIVGLCISVLFESNWFDWAAKELKTMCQEHNNIQYETWRTLLDG